MAEERQILLEIEVDKKGAQKQLEENAELLELNRAELSNLNKAYKDGELSVEEYAKAKLQLTQENKRLGAENRNLIRTLETEDNSLNSLRQSLSRLTAERNNINQQSVEGARRFDELQKSIKETTDAIKQQEEAGGDFRRSVGNYQQALKGSILETEVFGTSINGIGDKLKAFANPVTAAVGVLSALGAAYARTGRGAQDLARATDRLDSALNDFSNSIADLVGASEGGGIFDQFLRFAQTSFFGLASTLRSDLIVVVKESIREFELLELQSNRTAKELLDQAEQQRQIRDDDTNSIQDRIAANEELFNLIDEREAERVKTQEQQIKNLKILLNIDKGNIELQKQLLQAEFELADIREESQGFRSEALTNQVSLNKELQTEIELQKLRAEQESIVQIQALENIAIKQNEAEAIRKITFDSAQAQIEAQKRITESQRQQAEIRREIEQINNEFTLNASAQLSGSLSTLFDQNTAAYKATASIEAAISTYLAINKTLASLPFPANVISSVAVGVQGFANVAKINGLFGGGGGATTGADANQSTPRITRTTLDGSFDRNQLTSGANSAQSDRDNINNAIGNLPTPVVKVSDINKQQSKTKQVKVTGSL